MNNNNNLLINMLHLVTIPFFPCRDLPGDGGRRWRHRGIAADWIDMIHRYHCIDRIACTSWAQVLILGEQFTLVSLPVLFSPLLLADL